MSIDPKSWRKWGMEGAEARRAFSETLEDYADALDKLTGEDRAQAGNEILMGWIDRVGDIMSPTRDALQARWYTSGMAMGEMESKDNDKDDILSLSKMPLNSDLATDLKAMTPVNRLVAAEALMTGYIRGYAADMRTRLLVAGEEKKS